ncbi:MAG TPA: hypothetical protein DGT23_21365 [Micromonosporaceae bacterium]|nr:hypothetical protein [Micromonosporaceae bacterium]
MPRLGFARLLAVLTAVGVAAFASPAWANTTIDINEGNVPTTAAEHTDHECSDILGGGPFADKDVWVFNLPTQGGAAGAFVSVTATFYTGSGYLVRTIPTDGGDIVDQGTSKAWIVLDAGWTLTAASAEITGAGEDLFFVLTHTCPATSTSPSPSASASSSTSPSPSTSASSSASASTSASAGTPSPDPSSGSPGTSVSGSQPPLPRTGAAVMSMLVTGGVAIAMGAALLLLMRRRRANLTTLDD